MARKRVVPLSSTMSTSSTSTMTLASCGCKRIALTRYRRRRRRRQRAASCCNMTPSSISTSAIVFLLLVVIVVILVLVPEKNHAFVVNNVKVVPIFNHPRRTIGRIPSPSPAPPPPPPLSLPSTSSSWPLPSSSSAIVQFASTSPIISERDSSSSNNTTTFVSTIPSSSPSFSSSSSSSSSSVLNNTVPSANAARVPATKLPLPTTVRSRISRISCRNLAGMGRPRRRKLTSLVDNDGDDDDDDDDDDGDVQVVLEFNRPMIGRRDNDMGATDNFSTDLIAVTGETGSGKSLLLSKAVDLVTGGKATSSLLLLLNDENDDDPDPDQVADADPCIGRSSSTSQQRLHSTASTTAKVASVEMDLTLNEYHTETLKGRLVSLGLDPAKFLVPTTASGNNEVRVVNNDDDNDQSFMMTTLQLRRDINLVDWPSSSSTTTTTGRRQSSSSNGTTATRRKVKSTCFVNGHPVPLKVLRAVGVPLVSLVNAPVASAALQNPNSRLAMIDAGVPVNVLRWVRGLDQKYRRCRTYRQSLEQELEKQVLPTSMMRATTATNAWTTTNGETTSSGHDDDKDLDLLRHWTDELDGFENRITAYRNSLIVNSGRIPSLEEDASDLAYTLLELMDCDWKTTGSDESSSSAMYQHFLNLSDCLKVLDSKIESAMKSREVLCSLSSPDSAITALEKARRLLTDTQQGEPSPHSSGIPTKSGLAAERSHDLLNQVEEAMLIWSSFMDDDEKGLVATLRTTRNLCSTTVDELAERISEWNTLARKHGISPHQLPLCHATLKKQLDGGLEAKLLLPKAREEESTALQELQEGHEVLTKARRHVCKLVSESTSERFPSLGLGNSKFEARLRPDASNPLSNGSMSSSRLGTDEVDFILHHNSGRRTSLSSSSPSSSTSSSSSFPSSLSSGLKSPPYVVTGGKLENVASSGEKARILLAIECEIPGSIRALCSSSSSSISPETKTAVAATDCGDDSQSQQSPPVLPVAVIYDEIDAHVGGNASVAVADMLLDQSMKCQVVSITHSPSVAAVADIHVRVEKRGESRDNDIPSILSASQVTDVDRRKELARILSGDMATDDAEAFASALLREASAKKKVKSFDAATTWLRETA